MALVLEIEGVRRCVCVCKDVILVAVCLDHFSGALYVSVVMCGLVFLLYN